MSEIDRRWIIATLISSVSVAAMGLLEYGVREWIAAAVATPSTAKAIYLAASIVLAVGNSAVYAWVTGTVLRLAFPALVLRQWMILHLAIGLVFGVGGGVFGSITNEPSDSGDDVRYFFAFVVALGVVAGVTLGSLQALVLRHAAHGIGRWIGISILATTIFSLSPAISLWLYPLDGTFGREAVAQGAIFLGSFVAGVVMLLALRRMRPRTA